MKIIRFYINEIKCLTYVCMYVWMKMRTNFPRDFLFPHNIRRFSLAVILLARHRVEKKQKKRNGSIKHEFIS
jgi:hypothetical protein